MVDKKLKVLWDNQAKEYLKKSIEYIKQDSPQNAENVRQIIKKKVNEIPANPWRYPIDKYRLNNIGEFRAFEVFGFRISYYVGNTEIRVVRIRHTRQEPKNY